MQRSLCSCVSPAAAARWGAPSVGLAKSRVMSVIGPPKTAKGTRMESGTRSRWGQWLVPANVLSLPERRKRALGYVGRI
jgi:hypothetical protein